MKQKMFIVESLKARLDKYLAEQIKGVSRSQIQRDIEAGKVLVNGKIVEESKFVVRQTDRVIYQQSEISPFDRLRVGNRKSAIRPPNIPLKVLYDNHGLLIIDKPAGMVVHPGAGFKGETLASALLYQFSARGARLPDGQGSASGGKGIEVVGEEERPGIVHRLDKDTSGVILVAKTQKMYEHLKSAFQDRKIKKEYIALVLGKVEKPHGFIETPIGKSKTDFRKYDTKNIIEPKESLTEYKVLEYLEMGGKGIKGERGEMGVDQHSLLLVKLHTGRTHQIRVHFKSIGHPLIGDTLYGSKRIKIDGLNRQFLHAKKIEVQLPDGTWIETESELAEDLKQVLEKLGSKILKSL